MRLESTALLVLALVSTGGVVRASAQDAPPAPAMLPEAVGSPVPTASLVPGPEKISRAEGQKLLKSFEIAQASHVGGVSHRHQVEMKELKANHKHRRKEWEAAEREKRRAYFSENQKGADRRTFVKDFIERRKAFLAVLKEEVRTREQEYRVKHRSLVQDFTEKRKRFYESIRRGERPPQELWPQGQ